MERSPLISWVFHLRAISLLISLLVVDAFFVRRSWISLTTKGPSVEIVFGLEVGNIRTMVMGGGGVKIPLPWPYVEKILERIHVCN